MKSEVLQFLPRFIYEDYPCSVVAVGMALGITERDKINDLIPGSIKQSGYLTLKEGNRFIRSNLPVEKYEGFKRGERPTLEELLSGCSRRAVILVLGH